jgi:plasmid stabilization system protein ParE
MTLKLLPEAQNDLYEALEYYSGIDPKLKEKFTDDLDVTFSKILKFPNLYPFETETSQKTLMQRFPYIILYEKYRDIIMILAIFHTSRDDKLLANRL